MKDVCWDETFLELLDLTSEEIFDRNAELQLLFISIYVFDILSCFLWTSDYRQCPSLLFVPVLYRYLTTLTICPKRNLQRFSTSQKSKE